MAAPKSPRLDWLSRQTPRQYRIFLMLWLRLFPTGFIRFSPAAGFDSLILRRISVTPQPLSELTRSIHLRSPWNWPWTHAIPVHLFVLTEGSRSLYLRSTSFHSGTGHLNHCAKRCSFFGVGLGVPRCFSLQLVVSSHRMIAGGSSGWKVYTINESGPPRIRLRLMLEVRSGLSGSSRSSG